MQLLLPVNNQCLLHSTDWHNARYQEIKKTKQTGKQTHHLCTPEAHSVVKKVEQGGIRKKGLLVEMWNMVAEIHRKICLWKLGF